MLLPILGFAITFIGAGVLAYIVLRIASTVAAAEQAEREKEA